MTRWEYLIITAERSGLFKSGSVDFENVLQKIQNLGDEGWELVSTMDTNLSHGKTENVVLFFKRPKG